MVEVADIFRLHGPEYLAKFGDRMPPSHIRAMRDIQACRTETLGGQLYVCDTCHDYRYSYHSCKNRHCPKCGNHQAQEWLEAQSSVLLPVPYFMVTFTLLQELREVARSHQRVVYNMLFRASSEALCKLALDQRFIGGRLGMVGVLHTWTRALIYHPHVHSIVTGGALSEEGTWKPSRQDFLVPVMALSVMFRAKLRDQLQKAGLLGQVDPKVWNKHWVVHSEPVGTGEAAFKYLAPYISESRPQNGFRVAISNHRILKLEDGTVTFKYKESATDRVKTCEVTAEEFARRTFRIRRFQRARLAQSLRQGPLLWLAQSFIPDGAQPGQTVARLAPGPHHCEPPTVTSQATRTSPVPQVQKCPRDGSPYSVPPHGIGNRHDDHPTRADP